MDTLGLSIYNEVYERYIQKVKNNALYANINCNIDIGKIETKNITNCNLVFTNQCASNESTNFALLLQSLAEVMRLLPKDEVTKLENALGLTLHDIETEQDTGFIHQCKVEASVSNSIDIGTISLINCYSQSPVDFVFLNAGSVDANCGMTRLFNALKEKQPIVNAEPKPLSRLFTLDLMSVVVCILAIIFGYLLYCFIVLNIPSKGKITYYSRNTIIPKGESVLNNIYIRKANPMLTKVYSY